MKDPYIVLGVSREADADSIKAAYRVLLKTYHPDKAGNDPDVIEKFLAIRAAWEFLSDAHPRRPVEDHYRNNAQPAEPRTPRPEGPPTRSAFDVRGNEKTRLDPQTDIRTSSSFPAYSILDRIKMGVETLLILFARRHHCADSPCIRWVTDHIEDVE